jgi:hypothetical protein
MVSDTLIHRIFKWSCISIVLVFQSANAQDTGLSAVTDRDTVVLGEEFQLTFTFNGVGGTDFSPPSLEGFTLVSGPTQSSFKQSVSGSMSQCYAYSYVLHPRAEGRFTIGSASIKAQSRIYKSAPIPIVVLPMSAALKKSHDDWIRYFEPKSDTTQIVRNAPLNRIDTKRLREQTPRFDLVIPFDKQALDIETETRLLATPIPNDSAIVFQMEPAFYKLELRPTLSGATPLIWSVGAEHVYVRREVEKEDVYHSSLTKIGTVNGQLVLIAESGSITAQSRIHGWQILSDNSYPLTFKVIDRKHYAYICGRGKAISPSGHVYELGRQDSPRKWIPLLKSRYSTIREAAAQALGWLGSQESVPALLYALKDSTALVRRSTAEALGKIADARALEALRISCNDKHEWTAETAKWALARIKEIYKK